VSTEASRRTVAAAGQSAPPDEGFRLVSIDRASAPSGSFGADWLMYRIAQGKNTITGYRRGDIKRVRADVEKIVEGLNERRMIHRGRVNLTPSRSAAVSQRPRGDDLS
jgi:hypothetical protein